MADERTGGGWIERAYHRLQQAGAPLAPEPSSLLVVPHCAHIDTVHTPDDRHLILTGWAENIEAATLSLHDESDHSKAVQIDPVVIPRDDVRQHLNALGRPVATNRHGFVATIPAPEAAKVRLRLVRGGRAMWSAEFPLEPHRVSLREALALSLKAAEQSGTGTARNFERLVRAFVPDDPPPPAVVDVRRFGPPIAAGAALRVSIVVPFYGDGFYLLDHLTAQGRAPADVEWVFVCDDPALAPSLTDAVVRRQSALRQPTSLVYLQENGGFAHANNIGAAESRGEYLLLMNSDIHCRDFAFVDDAVDVLRGDPSVGCVGFSLRFEDDTIQHDGMTFARAEWYDGLWLSDHPGKGLRPDPAAPARDSVEAVTAALMLLPRRSLENGRVFDPGYLYGDFEDGDLCLRLRRQGKTIALLRKDGLYHLERQSVRRLADTDGRRAITLLNCLRFNARWRETLAGGWGVRS